MYTVVKLAALSAALAAAAVTLLDGPRDQPSAAKFLTDRMKTEAPAPSPTSMTSSMVVRPASTGCVEQAWPYRDSCAPAQPAVARSVRIISLDRRDASRAAGEATHAQIAQR